MRVLVTGVSGFVGRRLARRLLAAGHEVSGTYLGPPPELAGVRLREVDVLDRDGLDAVVAELRPQVVAHLAGLSHVGGSWSRMEEYFRVNVLGTERLLAATGETPVLFTSSAEVYGRVPEEEQPIREEREVAPTSPYALTKAAAERLVLARRGTVVRCFNLVGPGQSPRFVLPAFALQLARAAAGQQPPRLEVGNLEPRRDFVHVDDGAEALEMILSDPRPGEVLNVASGRAWSIREALDLLLSVSGQMVEVEVDASRLRPVDVPLLVGSNRRLRSLGWKPRRSLEEAVEELWRWAVAQGGSLPAQEA